MVEESHETPYTKPEQTKKTGIFTQTAKVELEDGKYLNSATNFKKTPEECAPLSQMLFYTCSFSTSLNLNQNKQYSA